MPDENSQTLGGSGLYAERPTITYVPLTGAKFTESLLTPIPSSAILFLVQAAYPVRLDLGVCVRTMNELDNYSVDPLWAREADPEFERMVDILERMQKAGGLAIRVEQRGESQMTVVRLRRRPVQEQDAREVTRLLGLEPTAPEFRVS